jgi:transcriptional regulator with XRE-family HTH domain
VELSLNTYSECVESFREADQLMGSAFRQKLSAYQRALELAGPEPERGFQSQFAADCGVSRAYISRINRVVSDPDLLTAVNNFSKIGIETLSTLASADPELKTAALDQLEQTGELTVADIAELSEFETAQIERDTELEREKTRKQILEYIQPSDSDISRFTHFLFSAGIQLDTYQQKTGEQLTAEKIADFIVAEATADSDRYSGDPEIFAESIRDLRQIVDLFSRALELVSDQRPPKLTLIK